ncbi:MAG: hypothetical protein H6962_14385 [Chromatiaceae bacterium]|nr:hypothetical protein [Chromatiaceae bacterium]
MANIIGGRRDASSVDCRLFERALRLEEGYLDQPHWGEILDEKEKPSSQRAASSARVQQTLIQSLNC